MSSEPILGIDLGTTYSLVGVVQAARPELVPNPFGQTLTPSVVAVRDGELMVGEAARAYGRLHPPCAAFSFKRDMGTEREFNLGSLTFSAPELSALVLTSLRQDAERHLGRDIRRAVLTVPAYFNDLQRQATRDAGQIAGLKVERLLNEPTAAAIAYGLHQMSREQRAVVLDLGGGTFDVTVLEILEGAIEILSTAGDTRLGGDDFTAALVAFIESWIERRLGATVAGDSTTRARLWHAAETAKCQLSRHKRTNVGIHALGLSGGREADVSVEIGVEEVEEAWQPLLSKLRAPVLRAMRDAALNPEAIDEVLLVGGATRMPAVGRIAAEVFGRVPFRHLAADEVVAQGAALQAALHAGDAAMEDLVVTDVAPFSLGVETSDRIGGRPLYGLFSPILERGTVIPASRVRTFLTEHALQREVHVNVYQGEHSLCRDNRLIGTLLVTDLPPGPAGEVQPLEVRFTYDLSGLLEVEVTVLASGRRERLLLHDSHHRMTPGQVSAARERMARLKFHPRDSLPNRAALDRADALHVELRGPARERLAAALAQFRAALEGQDEAEISPAREMLLAVVDSLRVGSAPSDPG